MIITGEKLRRMGFIIGGVDSGRYVNPKNPLQPVAKGMGGVKVPSFGYSYVGYDLRLATKWKTMSHPLASKLASLMSKLKSETIHLSIDGSSTYNLNRVWWVTNKVLCLVDPSRVKFIEYTGTKTVIHPGQMILSHTLEELRMPTDVVGMCQSKSSLARSGINSPVTPIEPGWRGSVTIEVYSVSPVPFALRTGQGITQVTFQTVDGHAQYDGVYQDQSGVVESRANEK